LGRAAWGVYSQGGAGDAQLGFGGAGGSFIGGTGSVPGDGIVASPGGSGAKAATFNGDVNVTGSLSKGGGSFQIDHPLDPANKYLYHSFVESPDMMNIYNGIATLRPDGSAEVQMPDWFEALNRDFRYQLTSIGAPGPNLYIARKVQNNRFAIAGGKPRQEVSWQVTGIRPASR